MAQALVNRAKNRGRGRSKGMGRAAQGARAFAAVVELFMECIDEDLSDAQKADFKSQQIAHDAAKAQIDRAKTNNAVIKFFDTPLTPEELEKYKSQVISAPIIQAASQDVQEQARSGSRRPQRKSALNARSVIALDEKDEDDDVIIVDPEPAQPGSARGKARGKRGKAQKDPPFVPPGGAQPNHPVASPIPVMSGSQVSNQSIALPQGVTFNNFAQVLAPNGVAVQYMPQMQGGMVRGPPPLPQALVHQPVARLPPPMPQVVPGTYGLGIKRPSGLEGDEPQPKKRQNKNKSKASQQQPPMLNQMGLPTNFKHPQQSKASKKKEEDANWVPLDEYYYSKQEGDPAYREEKGEFRFKCWYCHKMLYNNVRIMMHMQGHIDNDKQQHLDLSDLTQCKHCYKQFDTPFEMQSHVEKVHQNTSNVLVCRICEKDHETQVSLRQHMKASHNTCEMPYICQLCNFRSSVYNDVVDHFKKRHDSSQFALCLYCLKVFKLSVSKSSGWALTSQYYQHLQKHQIKSTTKKCSCCKLAFLNKQEAKSHKQRDHLPNFRGAISASSKAKKAASSTEQVMIKVPSMTSDAANKKIKSLNAPVTSKVQLLQGLRFNGLSPEHICYECKKPMTNLDHYKKYVECSLCRYATTCCYSYSAHMMGFHSGNTQTKWKGVPTEREMDQTWYCLCGFSTNKGNVQAYHLVTCSKRTAYSKKPEQKFFEYDDEQEEFNPFEPYGDESEVQEMSSPEKEIPSLFGALGLVRKPEKSAFPRKESPLRPVEIAESIISDVLDRIFPESVVAKKSTGGIPKSPTSPVPKSPSPPLPGYTGPDSGDIPPELTGSRKWSTVKIRETKAPSKDSVFLGVSEKTETAENKSELESAPEKQETEEKSDAKLSEKSSVESKQPEVNDDTDGTDGGLQSSMESNPVENDALPATEEEKMDVSESNNTDQNVCDVNKTVSDTGETVAEANDATAKPSDVVNPDLQQDDSKVPDGVEESMDIETEIQEPDNVEESVNKADQEPAVDLNEIDKPMEDSSLNKADQEPAVDSNYVDKPGEDSSLNKADEEPAADSNEIDKAVEESYLNKDDQEPAIDSERPVEDSGSAEADEEPTVDSNEKSRTGKESSLDSAMDTDDLPVDSDTEDRGRNIENNDSAVREASHTEAEEMETDRATAETEDIVTAAEPTEDVVDGAELQSVESEAAGSDVVEAQPEISEKDQDQPEKSDHSKLQAEEEEEEENSLPEEKIESETEEHTSQSKTELSEEKITEDESEPVVDSEEKDLSQEQAKEDEGSYQSQTRSDNMEEKSSQDVTSGNTQDITGHELSQTPSITPVDESSKNISGQLTSTDPGTTNKTPEDRLETPGSSQESSPSKSHKTPQHESPRHSDSKDSRGSDPHRASSSSYHRHDSGSHHSSSSRDRDGSYDRSDRRSSSSDYRKYDDRGRYSDNRRDDRYGGGHHRDSYRDDYRSRDNRYGGSGGGGGYNRDRYGGGSGYQQNRQDNRNYDHRQGGYHRNDNYNKRGWGRGHYGGGGGGYHGYY